MNPIIQMLNNNIDQMFNQMLKSNPQFAEFVRVNQNKSPEQIAMDYNLNPAILENILKK